MPTPIPYIPTTTPCIPNLIPRVPNMIPCMPIILLIPFFVSPFRLLQIAGDFYYLLKPTLWNNALLVIAHETKNNKLNNLPLQIVNFAYKNEPHPKFLRKQNS